MTDDNRAMKHWQAYLEKAQIRMESRAMVLWINKNQDKSGHAVRYMCTSTVIFMSWHR